MAVADAILLIAIAGAGRREKVNNESVAGRIDDVTDVRRRRLNLETSS